MARTCDTSMHRASLLASDVAVCCYCFRAFAPDDVREWCDEEGQTAVCPHCGVDAIVGFDGPVDSDWVQAAHARMFGTAT